MSTAAPKVRRLRLGPRSAGMLLTVKEFDPAQGEEGWRYELIMEYLLYLPLHHARNVIPRRSWGAGSDSIGTPTQRVHP